MNAASWPGPWIATTGTARPRIRSNANSARSSRPLRGMSRCGSWRHAALLCVKRAGSLPTARTSRRSKRRSMTSGCATSCRPSPGAATARCRRSSPSIGISTAGAARASGPLDAGDRLAEHGSRDLRRSAGARRRSSPRVARWSPTAAVR